LKILKFLKELKNKMTNQTEEEVVLPLGSDTFDGGVSTDAPITRSRRRPGPAPRSATPAETSKGLVKADGPLGNEKLFLVEGNIRLVPLPGEGAAVSSDQRRLVWATDDDAAVAKYVAYFTEMSTFNARYVVAGVSVTEAIR